MVKGLLLVTSADTNSVSSNSQREPVGDAGSATGRNELGRTSALMAALTGDWSDRRCELNPGPIVAMAMMICAAFGGGGAAGSSVSVLCGAGGGLTVQPPTSSTDAAMKALLVIQSRRQEVGTPIRVSTGLRLSDSGARPVVRLANLRSRQSEHRLLAQHTKP